MEQGTPNSPHGTPKTTHKIDEAQLAEHLHRGYLLLKKQIHKVIVGQDEVIEAILCCMLAGGHCIVQGVPGLAKTLMVHSIAQALKLKFNRIQFTPDLMPSDIIGADIIQVDTETQKRKFEFVKGPIFSNMVLADEINRTPPKTQSALLQAMQEREVTLSGRTYALDKPFFVLATQNPVEQEGTYPLPEAAQDRFMFMIFIDYPLFEDEHLIVKQTTADLETSIEPVLTHKDLLLFQKIVRRAPVSDTIIDYAIRLVRASRPSDDLATGYAKQYIKWGAGPRAGQYLILGAKARALIDGRVTPDFEDVQAVFKLVLRHRIMTNFSAEADGITLDAIMNDILDRQWTS